MTAEPEMLEQDDLTEEQIEELKVKDASASSAVSHAHTHAYIVGDPPPDDRLERLRPWQQTIIRELRLIPNVTRACLMANRTSVTSAYKHREENELFRELWDEALIGHTDKVEETLHDIAVNGHEKTYYGKDGEVKSVEKIRDVNAIKFWLSGNRPKTYRETHKVEVEHGLSAGMEDVLRAVRMRRQEQLTTPNVRELPVTEVKTLNVSSEAQDGESCEGSKPAE